MIVITPSDRTKIEKIWDKNPISKKVKIPFIPLRDGNWGVEEYSYKHDVFKGVRGIIERGESNLREVRTVDRPDTLMYDDE